MKKNQEKVKQVKDSSNNNLRRKRKMAKDFGYTQFKLTNEELREVFSFCKLEGKSLREKNDLAYVFWEKLAENYSFDITTVCEMKGRRFFAKKID